MYSNKKVYNFEVADWHTYFVGAWKWLVHNAGQACLSKMMLQSQKWFQNIMRGRNFNLAMNLFTRELAELAGKKFSKELYVKLATTVTKSGKIKKATKSGYGYIDSYIEGIGIIERKASDLAKVTTQTAKSYINDASKYVNATVKETGEELGGRVILQVENMKGVSQEVLDYAAKKGVEIIDDITTLFK